MNNWSKPFFMSEWQINAAEKTKHSIGGASIDSWSLQKILDLATDKEKKLWHEQSMQYSNIPGGKKLRQIISEQYKGLSEDNIIVFSGAQEALSCLYLSLLKKGSKAVSLTPSYSPMNFAIANTGALLTEFPLAYSNNSWSLNFDQLNQQLANGTELLVVNFPHNPTGFIPELTDWQLTIEHLKANNQWVICDEVFKELEFNKDKALPPVCNLLDKGISVGSLSKSYGCPSLRIGWVATHNLELIKKLKTVKRYFSICSSFLDEQLATIMLRNKDLVHKQNTELLTERYQNLIDQNYFGLTKWIEFSPMSAGLLLFPKLKNQTQSKELLSSFLDETGYRLEPGECSSDLFLNHFRLSIGSEHVFEGLRKLNNYLETKSSN